jgi:enamine deaminase RidA (YjgF/YER057c/UK114 family)
MSSVVDLSSRPGSLRGTGTGDLPGAAGYSGFPAWRRVGETVYLGAQRAIGDPAPDSGAAIEAQTHAVFAGMVDTLQAAGLEIADLVKLHTFYVFEGQGAEVTRYWERMTGVRLQYLADPGPAATALRVAGTPTRDTLITIDGIAAVSTSKRRLMPRHAWDWSIPTPFSQGWRVGDKVYVGGQISADRRGKTVAVDNVQEQTRNTLEYIRHVLLEAGASWEDLVTLKICYRHHGNDAAASALLEEILTVVRDTVTSGNVALTCLGIDLLYEGLVLEIDAMAVIGSDGAARRCLVPAQALDWAAVAGFCPGVAAAGEAYIGAVSAPGSASLLAQMEATMERLRLVLGAGGFSPQNLLKLNVFFQGDMHSERHDSEAIVRILGEYLPHQRPVLSVLRVAGLPLPGQRVQVDAIAAGAGA